jgi:hypothetical protein
MKQITLSQGKIAIVDDEDFERVNQFKWFAKKDENTWYARRTVRIDGKRKNIHLHTFIMNTALGFVVDHKNHNGLDNRKENLRLCSKSQNQHNQKLRQGGTSQYKGVCWHKNKRCYFARIVIAGKQKHLGSFTDEVEAAKAYDEAAKEHFGEFAHLNFKD